MNTTLLTRLQNWYLTNCDGDWEHSYEISINTLDNPGWAIKIDLSDTCLQDLHYDKQIDNGIFDWLFIKVTGKVLEASGDPAKLTTILTIFLDEIIPNYADQNFEYEVYVQLIGGPTKIWRPVKAKMISEDTLQITRLPDLDYKNIRTATLEDLTFDKEEIFHYKTNIQVGNNIKIELIETFNGVTLIAKE
ncbi:MAG TPA: immunity 53 family protein [Ginsengibacter sp.]